VTCPGFYATFAVTMVFFPVLTMSRLAGRLFASLGEAYIWSIVPPQEPPIAHWLKRIYRRVLMGVERASHLSNAAMT
jgi:hypothetical protein